jgi:formate-dependent nitrite reductase membrane component NrfD
VTNTLERAPYGRREASFPGPRDGTGRPYRGETYYNRPAVRPGHWRWLITTYFFVGGLAGAAQVIAAAADLAGSRRDRTVVRAGRYLALAGVLASPPLLIADLWTPARFYNMLRIVRPTSPMSIGSWTLTTFGLFSSLTALAQGLDDVAGVAASRRAARWFGLPAAAAGMLMAVYTGALSTSTSVPLWAAVPRTLPPLFGLSSAESALAALSLIAEAAGASEGTHRRLDHLALLAGGGELALHMAVGRTWRQRAVDGPLAEGPLPAARWLGMVGLGAAVPVAVHAAQQITGRRSRPATVLASVAALAGIFIERAVIIFGGNESARRPADYLRFTQPAGADGDAAGGR